MMLSNSYWHPSESQLKNPAIATHAHRLQNLLGKKRNHIREIFEKEKLGGAKAAKSFSRLSDYILLEHILPLTQFLNHPEKNWAVCATSIYGSGHLSPFDTLNFVLLYKGGLSDTLKKDFETLLYLLWSGGFRLRAQILSCEDKKLKNQPENIPIPLRFLFGNKDILSEFREINRAALQKQINLFLKKSLKSLYLQQELHPFSRNEKEESSAIHKILKFDYILNFFHASASTETFQKNVKIQEGESYPLSLLIENKILLPHEITLFRTIWAFLWTVRFHLHYLSDRAQNNLTPFLQPLIAAKMKYPGTRNENYQEQFMRHYFIAIRSLDRLKRSVTPFCFENNDKACLIPPQNNLLFENPIYLLRLIEQACMARKNLLPDQICMIIRFAPKLRSLSGDPEASRILLNLIRKAPLILGKYFLNNTGILSAMIPLWSRFFGLTRTGRNNVFYLLDQECLNIIHTLTFLEHGLFRKKAPLASSLFGTISEWKALYLTALLRKIGETAENDSYVESAKIARDIAMQLGLSEAEQETVYWLILHQDILHDSLNTTENVKQKMRDISRKIQSPNRLKLIYLLTIADIISSRHDISTNWDECLLQNTYFRLCNRLRGNLTLKQKNLTHLESKREKIKYFLSENEDHDILNQYLKTDSYNYWSKFSIDDQKDHFKLLKEFLTSPLKVKYQVKIYQQETIITLIVPNFPNILTYLTKRLSEIQVNVNYGEFFEFPSLKASLFILRSPWYGGIVTTIEESIQNLTILLKFAFDEDAKNFEAVLQNDYFPEYEKHPILLQKERILCPARLYFDQHFFDNFNNTLFIEINGRDSKGCLSRICATLTKYNMLVKQAHIRTYGVRITNIFYVTSQDGDKISDPKILAQFESDMLHILNRNFDL